MKDPYSTIRSIMARRVGSTVVKPPTIHPLPGIVRAKQIVLASRRKHPIIHST